MVYIAADHRGFEAKNEIVDFLKLNNYEVEDLGATELIPDDDYPDYAIPLAEKTVESNALGIVLCGSGVGVSIAANKVKGARAAYIESVEHAVKAKQDDNANVLVLDAMTFDENKDFEIIKKFLETEFSNAERHNRRINKIYDYENNNE